MLTNYVSQPVLNVTAYVQMKREQSSGVLSETITPTQLVSGEDLLRITFPETSRPTIRWLRDQQKNRRIPFIKIGRLVFFNPEKVRAVLDSQRTAQTGGLK